eukprot:gene8354-894_t
MASSTLVDSLVSLRDDVATTFVMMAAAGNLEAVQALIEHKKVDANAVKKKGGNTALHAALAQNHWYIIDFLLSVGADVNVRNERGQTPLMMAIACCHGLAPIQKLLAAGALVSIKNWRFKQTALDIARAKGFAPAVSLLEAALVKENSDREKVKETEEEDDLPNGKQRCPICGDIIRTFPRICFLFDKSPGISSSPEITNQLSTLTCKPKNCSQVLTPPLSENNRDSKVFDRSIKTESAAKEEQGKDYETVNQRHDNPIACQSRNQSIKRNPYIDAFERSKAFNVLRSDPRYHTLADKHHLRKEITETGAVLKAVEAQVVDMGLDVSRLTLVDLCSGKSLTSALFGIEFPHSTVFAVDRLPSSMVPHFDRNVTYIQANIMLPSFIQELVSVMPPSQPAVLVGMHLCGGLSLRAIEVFTEISLFKGIILSPCCFPSRRSKINIVRDSGLCDEMEKYKFWTNFLEKRIFDVSSKCNSYTDIHVYSNRNNIIWGTR